MKIIELEDHHINYLGNLLDDKWRRLDKERGANPHTSPEYRATLAEQQRVENIQLRLRDAVDA